MCDADSAADRFTFEAKFKLVHPAGWRTCVWPPLFVANPAESSPRYSNRLSPLNRTLSAFFFR